MSPRHKREEFLLPSGCSELVDAIHLKQRQAARRAEVRRLSRTRVSDAFGRWRTWAERYADMRSADVRDPEFGQFLEFAALLSSREKSKLESRIAAHPLGARIHQQLMKNLLSSPQP